MSQAVYDRGEDASSSQSSKRGGGWTTHDVLTFVVFNIIIVVVTMAAKMVEDMLLSPQNTFFVGSWLFPLLATPFYLVMADRIGKRGVLSARSSSSAFSTLSWAACIAFPWLSSRDRGRIAMWGRIRIIR